MEKRYSDRRMKIEDIQKNLDTLKPLKFSNDKKEFKNIEEIIRFACQRDFLIDNSTKQGNRLQCSRVKSRGIADLYRICKNYFPNTTLKDVVKTVEKIPMSYHYCHTTNQDVYRTSDKGDYTIAYTGVDSIKSDPAIRLKNRRRVYIE